MAEKTLYIAKLKELYRQKKGVELSDELAMEYFESLTLLVSAITRDVRLNQLILTSNGK